MVLLSLVLERKPSSIIVVEDLVVFNLIKTII